jgi:HEAT repeat protein
MKEKLMLVFLMMGLAGCAAHPGSPVSPRARRKLPAVPPVVAMPMDAALSAQARAELESAENSSDEVLRAHALEVLKKLNAPDAGPTIMAKLGDNSRLVRKSAALAAGELQYRPVQTRLNQMLETANGSERIAIIFALHRMGDPSHSHELEKTAVDSDPHIRGDTAMVLGMLGEKSAVPMLHAMLKDTDRAVRLESAEALWKLGDPLGSDGLEAATLSANPDDRMVALLALAEPRDTQVLGNIEGLLTDDYVEVALVAARAAGMLGSDDGYGLALQSASSSDVGQRVLAGMALASIGRADAQPALRKLLADTNPDARLVAAGAILAIGKRE